MKIFSKTKIYILLTFLVLLILFLNNKYNNEKIYFPITEIKIIGIKNANIDIISKISNKYLEDKSFFNFRMKFLKKEIEKIEWVKNVGVRRIYPNGVSIHIEEHKPVVVWNNKSYLDYKGDIFLVNKVDKNLPNLNSKKNRNKAMFEYFSLFNKYLSIYDINDTIVEIYENEIRSVKISLASGVNIELGSDNVRERIEMFFKIYKKLKSRDLKKIRYIDMRYSNGFSIGWK